MTACWLSKFVALNSKANRMASLDLLTLKAWTRLKSVWVYRGMRAPCSTLPTLKMPVLGSWVNVAQVPRWSKYWQDDVLSTTGMQVDFA